MIHSLSSQLARLISLAGLLALTACVTACVTPSEEQQFRDDIFNLQSRVVQLEGQSTSLGKEITTQTSRQEASVSTRLDKFAIEVQRIKGDIDALKVGVTTGQMPGSDPEQEGSLAKTLSDVNARLDALEENQNKILAAIDKAIEAKKPDKKEKEKAPKKSSSLKTYDDIKTAFDKKKYKLIAEEGGKVVDEIKSKKDKQEALFMLAESHYKNGQVREAALRFNEFQETKPKERMAQSLLRMGDCFKELKDLETAKIYYQELLQKYANSEEAKEAKSKLAKL